jgi:hypothetical protein
MILYILFVLCLLTTLANTVILFYISGYMVQLRAKLKEGFDVTTENFGQLVEQMLELFQVALEKEEAKKPEQPMPMIPKTWEEGLIIEEEMQRRRMREILEKDNDR